LADSKRVVIIGGGIIGLCTAYYCLKRGHSVTIVERGGPDHDCCSLGNAGMVVPSHFVPLASPGVVGVGIRMMFRRTSSFSIQPQLNLDLLRWLWRFYRSANAKHVEESAPLLRDLHLASRNCFEDLETEIGDFGLARNGLLMLCATERALEEERKLAEAAKKLNMPAEVLNPDETCGVEPNLRMSVASSVHFPMDCHLSPNRLMHALTHAVEEGGGQFIWSSGDSELKSVGDRIGSASTAAGAIIGDAFVVSAGSWSPQIIRPLGLRLPIQAGKGYSFDIPVSGALSSVRTCAILTEARVAVTPMDSSLRFAGTLELSGLDMRPNPHKVRGIMGSIPRYFPDFKARGFEGLPVWTGLRPCSPDGLPYIGRFQRFENVYAATGHAMMGVSLGPITGRLIAEMVSDENPSIDVTKLSPDRFA